MMVGVVPRCAGVCACAIAATMIKEAIHSAITANVLGKPISNLLLDTDTPGLIAVGKMSNSGRCHHRPRRHASGSADKMATISRKGAVTVPGTYDRPVIDHSGCPHISSRQHIMSSPTTHHEFPAALQN